MEGERVSALTRSGCLSRTPICPPVKAAAPAYPGTAHAQGPETKHVNTKPLTPRSSAAAAPPSSRSDAQTAARRPPHVKPSPGKASCCTPKARGSGHRRTWLVSLGQTKRQKRIHSRLLKPKPSVVQFLKKYYTHNLHPSRLRLCRRNSHCALHVAWQRLGPPRGLWKAGH